MAPLPTHSALLIVDVQRDFLPGGALAVRGGDQVVPAINRCIALLRAQRVPVWATRDWHPVDHCSFQAQGGPWPAHCVRETPGARFAAELCLPARCRVVSKGTRQDQDAYSGFDGTDLQAQLQAADVSTLYVVGLATDYCVRATVLDALRLGLSAIVLRDAVRAVDVHPGDGERALAEMRAAGAGFASVAELENEYAA